MHEGLRVTQPISGVHDNFPEYFLLPGDLLVSEPDGTFFKVSPGLGIAGFQLSDDYVSTLEPVLFQVNGLLYQVVTSAEMDK